MERPLQILSLDGGGIRGISTLLILESIMETVKEEKKLSNVPLPCEYFDLIGGTSTGGIIAIMLGRLQMSVDECIRAYKKVAEQAFTPRALFQLPVRPTGAFSARALEAAIQQVIVDQCKEEECKEAPCKHKDKLFGDVNCSKTVVLAKTKSNIDASPTLFKTYDMPTSFKDCTIWQVARATSAATTFFESIKCGRDGIEFIDAGFGNNNPCDILLEEVERIFPQAQLGAVISIGTGLGEVVEIRDSRSSILKALKEMASSSQSVAVRMERRFGGTGVYSRFNVTRGLQDISLSDWQETSTISAHTHNYIEEKRRRIDECSKALKSTVAVSQNTISPTTHEPVSSSQISKAQNTPLVATATVETPLQSTKIGSALDMPHNAQSVQSSSDERANATPSAMSVPQKPANISLPIQDQKITNEYFEIPLDTNVNFVDREKLVLQLEEYLAAHDNNLSTGRRVYLYGLGGSGKTEIAVRFAERHRNDYFAVFWITAIDEARIIDGFQSIAYALGLDHGAESRDGVVMKVRHWLSTHSRWLVIIDNLDDDMVMDIWKGKYISAGMKGDVLITTRNAKAATQGKAIEVCDMEEHEATTLLGNIVGTRMADGAEFRNLSKDLGYLPLALDQAASFIVETGISISQYRKFFAAEERRLLEHYPSTQYNQENRHNVMTTWEISYNYINRDNARAAKLLLLLSLLYYDDIPGQILESAFQGQRFWAANGDFEELPQVEHWIPSDLLTLFTNQLCLLEATSALMKFSLLRRQVDSMSFRMHPLVHFWASQRLLSDPELKQQLTLCTIGLVAGCFRPHDSLPPLSPRIYGIRGLEESTLGLWPWRQYPNIALHAHRCLQYAETITKMPESFAHHILSLLQVLEYTTVQSLETDQELSLSVISHVEKFQTTPDFYLRYSTVLWRLARADLCPCRKHTHIHPTSDLVSDDTPNNTICRKCVFAYNQAKVICYREEVTPRMIALNRALRFRLESDKCWLDCCGSHPRPFSIAMNDRFEKEIYSRYSSLEKYEAATRGYLHMRASYELQETTSEYLFFPARRPTESGCSLVTDVFKSLCGSSSEEYRRSMFYLTSAMVAQCDDLRSDNGRDPWHRIEVALKPLVEASIANPKHSWSHERCVTRYSEALLKQGKVKEAHYVMAELAEAYRPTGSQLRSVERAPLGKDGPYDVPPRNIQIFVKTLTGRTIRIDTNTCATVRSITDTIAEREGVNWTYIRFIYGLKQLDHNRLLSDYNIQKDSTIHLVLRMAGG